MSSNFSGIGGPAAVNLHVLADGLARLLQSLPKRPDASLKFRVVYRRGRKYADAPYRLLRTHCPRPCRRAAEQGDELAALHSITSSARTKIDGGTVRPSALAVLAFTTISNFTGT